MRFFLYLFLFISFNSVANNNDYFIKIDKHSEIIKNNQKYDVHDYGSAIPWNNEYAVTAKHVSFVKNSVYVCSENCDIQFIKFKNSSPIRWRNPVAHEKLTFLGNNKEQTSNQFSGKDLDFILYMNGAKVTNYPFKNHATNTQLYVSDSPVSHGQSGGPVIGSDGKVVGMIIGETTVTDIKTNKKFSVSLYIPYQIIQKEWLKFTS